MKFVISLLVASLVYPLATYAQSRQTETEVDRCIMTVSAMSGLSPNDEAYKKVRCFEGTKNMVDKCERTVSGTMRISAKDEQHYRHQCRIVAN